jgi:dCMP deaminase
MDMSRISKDEYYLDIALAVSKRSTCLKRHYGCVIVKNDEIIATGYNGSPRGYANCCDIGFCKRLDKEHNSGDYSDCHSVHAEQNAMLSASRKDMIGSTMYLAGEERDFLEVEYHLVNDCEPCPICSRMLANSGIERVISNKGIVWERTV